MKFSELIANINTELKGFVELFVAAIYAFEIERGIAMGGEVASPHVDAERLMALQEDVCVQRSVEVLNRKE